MTAEHYVTATLNYMNVDEGEIWVYDRGPGLPRRSYGDEVRETPVYDARKAGLAATIDSDGFELIRCAADVAFNADPALVKASYYPATERLVKKHLGAVRVHAFDHDFRSTSVKHQSEHLRPAVMGVHNDYTESSGPQRVRDLLPGEAETLLQRRFAFINVWKPIGWPAEGTPLAMCDARTLGPGDLTLIHLRYRDRNGEIYGGRYNQAQRWYYYPAMTTSEAVLLKVYDSDRSRARFTLHTAFVDPTAPKEAPARQSIEVRSIAFF